LNISRRAIICGTANAVPQIFSLAGTEGFEGRLGLRALPQISQQGADLSLPLVFIKIN